VPRGVDGKIAEVDAFNKIARKENNFHSFYIYKTGEDIQATLTLEEVAPVEQCIGGSFAAAAVAVKGGKATLEMTTGTYRKCPTATGYTADYTKTAAERLDLGDDPELLNYVKPIKRRRLHRPAGGGNLSRR
jgi:hypothetical protein